MSLWATGQRWGWGKAPPSWVILVGKSAGNTKSWDIWIVMNKMGDITGNHDKHSQMLFPNGAGSYANLHWETPYLFHTWSIWDWDFGVPNFWKGQDVPDVRFETPWKRTTCRRWHPARMKQNTKHNTSNHSVARSTLYFDMEIDMTISYMVIIHGYYIWFLDGSYNWNL